MADVAAALEAHRRAGVPRADVVAEHASIRDLGDVTASGTRGDRLEDPLHCESVDAAQRIPLPTVT